MEEANVKRQSANRKHGIGKRKQNSFLSSILFTTHYSPFTRKSFTLAEVLITLGIIGVVAGMTIPVLMQNIQDNEFKTKMRKEYSVLSQAQQLLIQESGGTFIDVLASYGNIRNSFKQKLSYITECTTNNGSFLNVCFITTNNVKLLNGNNAGTGGGLSDVNNSGLVLKDGTSVSFHLDSTSCNSSPSPNYTDRCGIVIIDVNGIKPPNMWGRDIYLFTIFSTAMRPAIAATTVTTTTASADDCGTGTNNGYTCSAKYILGN